MGQTLGLSRIFSAFNSPGFAAMFVAVSAISVVSVHARSLRG